ncbi:sensor histidine kinase [Skermanella sp. TT6]|uniref:histidine kinase n=1 Tax=Skermanella cutis TaxID=2775420 RepID=A0ABX7B608_9PROT|nr:ATP-binding protein [Skermanella sp. TT6]QQP89752.1 sensor histidine kinase [Skermanella sp. TT6]
MTRSIKQWAAWRPAWPGALPRGFRGLAAALALAACALVPPASWFAAEWARGEALEELAETAQARLSLYTATLTAEIEKYRVLPLTLAWDPDVAALLASPRDAALVDRVDRKLAALNAGASLSALYVMARDGTTLASSNWTEETSFIGRNFAFRPYFREALAGRVGRYFAMGTTSQKPGYYIAYPVWAPVWAEHHTVGVVVAKVAMEPLEATWHDMAGERVFVTDRRGVVFITNVPDWRFRTLAPLPPEVRREFEASQQYEGTGLEPLPPLDSALVHRGPVPDTDWKVHVALDSRPADARARSAGLVAGIATLLLLAAGLVVLQRRLALAERLEYQRRAQLMLEHRVTERTAELSSANLRLTDEIAERGRAEQAARRAQEDLIQAAKLAALGQMAAGIVHEVNQPISAIRSYAENAALLLDRGRLDLVRGNLLEITGLTERVATITRQLKTFARKSSGMLGPVSPRLAVDRSMALLGAQAAALGADMVLEMPDEATQGPLPMVLADEARLEQVIVNLLRNALDAVSARNRRLVAVSLEQEDGHVLLKVRDTGPGIPEDDLPRLFDPFFTTKEVGVGLGLGLSISYGIVQDFGGRIAAANHEQGGAVFTVALRPAPPSGPALPPA